MAQILVFGDSIAYGAYDKMGGWVQRLRMFLETKPEYVFVYNLGVDADSSLDVLHRAYPEMTRRFYDDCGKNLVIFAIGMNDSMFNLRKRQFKTTPVSFRTNLLKLAKTARKHTPNIIFMGLNPVDDSLTVPIPWKKDSSYVNNYVERYNDIIKSFCSKYKINFVDIFDEWAEGDYKKLLEDGVHPNSKGHERIFKSVSEFLIKKKLI